MANDTETPKRGINPVLHAGLVYLLLIAAVVGVFKECSRANSEVENNRTLTETSVREHNRDRRTIDSLQRDLLTWKGIAEACEGRAKDALNLAKDLTLQLKNALYEVGGTIDTMSGKDQQISTLKRLVANKHRLAPFIVLL